MNFSEVLGKSINDLAALLEDYTLDFSEGNIDDGIEPTWILESKDGSIEIFAYNDQRINSVFLRPSHGLFHFFDFSTATTRQQVREKMGRPTHSSNEKNIKTLNEQGNLDSYHTNSYSIQFNYTPGEPKLESIFIKSLLILT
jgi:hypothetical protein